MAAQAGGGGVAGAYGGAIGPPKDTSCGDIVTIHVESEGPYGVSLEADEDGCAAVIKGFEKLPSGKFGPLQKHGGVHFGDVLFAINDIQLDVLPFAEVMGIIRDRNLLKKAFKFMNSGDYYHRKRKKANALNLFNTDQKNNFLSIVRRARVVDELKSRKFVQYEVACQMRVVSMKLQKEIVYKWSVWKRYTEFAALHEAIKTSFGWQLGDVEFPSTHVFVLNKTSPEFIEARKEEINAYWQRILRIPKITEFSKHHCSQDLRAFLDTEAIVRGGGASNGGGGDMGDFDLDFASSASASASSSGTSAGGGSASAKRASAKPTARRRSTNAVQLLTDSETGAGASVLGAPPQPAARPRPVSTPAPSSSSSSSSSSLSSAAAAAAPTGRGGAPPPPPPPPPPRAAAPPPPASASGGPLGGGGAGAGGGGGGGGGAPLPKATGARVNLLADIAKRRID